MEMQRLVNHAIVAALDPGDGPSSFELPAAECGTSPLGRLLFLGDVSLALGVAEFIEDRGTPAVFSKLPPDFFRADVVCFNLECCLTRRGVPIEYKPVYLVGEARYLDAFPCLEQCVAVLANNHFLDRGVLGAVDTLTALEERGVAYVGARGPKARAQPCIKDTPGGRVAMLAFSSCSHALRGTNAVNVEQLDAEAAREAVQKATQQADQVCVLLHHGIEYFPFPHPRHRALCRTLATAGAHLIVCHHPHVPQGVECLEGAIVAHSVGNFLFDVRLKPTERVAQTVALRVWLAGGRICRVQFEPLVINDTLQPSPMDGVAREEFLAHMRALSVALHHPCHARRWARKAVRARLQEQIAGLRDNTRHLGLRGAFSYYSRRLSELFSSHAYEALRNKRTRNRNP